MLRKLPKGNSSGYTIIEIIISLFILIMIFSVVQANYRGYVQRSNIDTARNQMISDIKLTREYALAGKKPEGCDNLIGYVFRTETTGNRYSITADCDTNVVVKTVNLSDISAGIFISNNANVTFRLMGLGTDAPSAGRLFRVTQQTSGTNKDVRVYPGGEVR